MLPLLKGVKIERYAAEGKCVAHFDSVGANGGASRDKEGNQIRKVLFVPFAAEGDVCDVQILKSRSSFAEGKIVNMVEPSPVRVQPMCQHFGVCGGCKWQNLPYEEQIKAKSLISPHYGDNFHLLKKVIRCIEFVFHINLMPEQVTDLFWNHFVSYVVGELKMQPSTCVTLVNQLRSTLNWASRHRCPVSDSFDCISLPKVDKDMVALTLDDVSYIYHFRCEHINMRPQAIRNLERVRDAFVLSCNLGQRHSDMIRIDKSNFNRNIFKCVQQKTGNKAVVNIDEMALFPQMTYNILEKYDYNMPHLEDAVLNRYLKDICRDAGLTEEIEIVQTTGGTPVRVIKPKYKLVHSHTARRTGATLMYLSGMDVYDIIKITGHSTPGMLKKYIKADKLEVVDKIIDKYNYFD